MKLKTREITAFAVLGALMFTTKFVLQALPNVHLVGVFIVAETVVYRAKALFPIYVYVFLEGLVYGFNLWWIPYLYIWTVLWGAVMLLPKKMPIWLSTVVYAVVCSLHGFLFGTLWAPAQALFYGLDFKGTLSWIALGFPYDVTHGISNFVCGVILIMPMIRILRLTNKSN